MTALTFTIPPEWWMTSNRPIRQHGHRQSIVNALHDIAVVTAHTARLRPLVGPVAADWTICYPKGVRRDKGDAANAHPTCKALLDGMVPRWLVDDGPLYVVAETFRRGPNLDRAKDHEIRLVLTSQEVPW